VCGAWPTALASGCYDGVARLWRADGRCVAALRGCPVVALDVEHSPRSFFGFVCTLQLAGPGCGSSFVVDALVPVGALPEAAPASLAAALYVDIGRYAAQWAAMGALGAVYLLTSFFLPVPGCPTGYLGAGGLAHTARGWPLLWGATWLTKNCDCWVTATRSTAGSRAHTRSVPSRVDGTPSASKVTPRGPLKDAEAPVPSVLPRDPEPAKVVTTPAGEILRIL
jgi:hypothetical protein